MATPEDSQGKPHGSEEQAARAKSRVASRRRWIKAAGLAAVPLIITVRAQPAFAGPGKTNKASQYGGKK